MLRRSDRAGDAPVAVLGAHAVTWRQLPGRLDGTKEAAYIQVNKLNLILYPKCTTADKLALCSEVAPGWQAAWSARKRRLKFSRVKLLTWFCEMHRKC